MRSKKAQLEPSSASDKENAASTVQRVRTDFLLLSNLIQFEFFRVVWTGNAILRFTKVSERKETWVLTDCRPPPRLITMTSQIFGGPRCLKIHLVKFLWRSDRFFPEIQAKLCENAWCYNVEEFFRNSSSIQIQL